MPLRLRTAQPASALKADGSDADQTVLTPSPPRGSRRALIFDVDGVLLDSPHERAWREALSDPAARTRFTTAFYQAYVAGRSRLDGARATLEALGAPHSNNQVLAYAQAKQKCLQALIAGGGVTAFPDALRFVAASLALGFPMAVASASKNAAAMLEAVRRADGESLASAFSVKVCGRDLEHGKPDPEIFRLAARELDFADEQCVVIEDATAGIIAARSAGMTALGLARHGDGAALRAAGAHLVVTSLDQIDPLALRQGQLHLLHPASDILA